MFWKSGQWSRRLVSGVINTSWVGPTVDMCSSGTGSLVMLSCFFKLTGLWHLLRLFLLPPLCFMWEWRVSKLSEILSRPSHISVNFSGFIWLVPVTSYNCINQIISYCAFFWICNAMFLFLPLTLYHCLGKLLWTCKINGDHLGRSKLRSRWVVFHFEHIFKVKRWFWAFSCAILW